MADKLISNLNYRLGIISMDKCDSRKQKLWKPLLGWNLLCSLWKWMCCQW